MGVALNALALRPDGAGVSTYIRELLAALPSEWQRTCTALVQSDAAVELPVAVRRREVSRRAGARRAATGLLERPPRGDLVHGMDVDLPLRLRGPSITTVHDLSVFDVPWAFPPGRVRGEQAVLRRALRHADAVLAVSHFTAERVRALSGRECVVTPLAAGRDMVPAGTAGVDAVRRRYALPDRFVLHVGTVEPRKDVARLADACKMAGLPLVLAGGGASKTLSGQVRRLGFVPRADLPALYGAATVTAYVSVYEGFGLPPVEALACAARVVATPVADLRDLLGDRVVWTRQDTDAMTDALLRAAEAGARPAPPRLSWRETAQLTLQAYSLLGACPESSD